MRSKSIAAVAALWQEEEGYPSDDFLRALHPEMPDVKQKLRGKLVKPGTCIGEFPKRCQIKQDCLQVRLWPVAWVTAILLLQVQDCAVRAPCSW